MGSSLLLRTESPLPPKNQHDNDDYLDNDDDDDDDNDDDDEGFKTCHADSIGEG